MLFTVIVFLFQDLDEKRIKNIKNFMLSSVDVERKVFPIIMQCLDGMEQAANSINEKEVNSPFIYFHNYHINSTDKMCFLGNVT